MATSTLNRENQPDKTNPLFSRTVVLNWEIAAYIVILILAVFTRSYMLGERVMSHDESLHTVFSHNLYERGVYEHNPMMHGPILFHFTALNYHLFGPNDFTARIYTAVLGILMVMMPLLFRRWIGRWGALLASIMLLISPLLLYYHRYIRHDTPSILAGMVMFYAAMMYLSGPENQRRRAHWLYVLSAAMLWNLGSKETAFIYIAIFGAFLTLYWLVRMVQHFYSIDGKQTFTTITIGILLAVVAALGMIVILSISLERFPTLSDRLVFLGAQFGDLLSGQPIALEFSTFLSWTGLLIVAILAVVIGPALWAYRRGSLKFSLPDVLMVVFAVLIFVVFSTLLSTSTRAINGDVIRISAAAVGFAIALLIALALSLIYAAFRVERVRSFRKPLLTVLLIALGVMMALIVFEELSHEPSRTATEIAAPALPEGDGELADGLLTFSVAPLVLVWIIGAGAVGFMLFMRARRWWEILRQFPEFDVLIVMGSLILPWLTAVFIYASRGSPADFALIGGSLGDLARLVPVTGDEAVGRVVVGFIAWVPMMTIAVVAGLMWNWRRWLICFLVFHALFAFFFTTVFTNIQGLATGMVYSLEYWLEQQGVKRGSQPQYYYLLLILPFYEFLPVVGSIGAMIAGMGVFWRKRRAYDEARAELLETTSNEVPSGETAEAETNKEDKPPEHKIAEPSRWRLTRVPFLLFVGWWAVFNLLGYTLAGEKMPWLGTHLTVPLILLAGWYFGRIVARIELSQLTNRGWVYLLLLPFLFVAAFQLITPFFGGRPPFAGTQQIQLEWTYNWLAAAVVCSVVSYIIYRLSAVTGWQHVRQMFGVVTFAVLALLTFRSAWMSSYINYDYATEYLVYAHGAPANKTVTDELRDLSIRTTGGMDLRVLYDNRFSWPGSWYMRDFDNALYIGENPPTLQQLDDAVAVIVGDTNRPKVEPLLEDRFQRFDHVRMWWPNQDYFGLNAQRINSLFDLNDANSGAVRRGMFDIWWARDYSTYAQAAGKTLTLTNWSHTDTMHLYVRKDYAVQVWPYGVGDATVLTPFTEVEVNLCTANWEPRAASVVFDTSTNQMLRPLGLAVAPDGRIFIAEEGMHRISIYSPDGEFLSSFGQQGIAAQDGAFFERPHSVAVDTDGSIFVVDTWNYKIRAFSPDFEYVTSWGQPTTAGFDARTEPLSGFWGPRDIVINAQGHIYVADTGNKRIRVYEPDGTFVRDIGSGGSGEGQLNEPAGIALHPDGRLYIADTWNRRVSVFTQDGVFLNNFSVRGWYDELGNRPYLAVDPSRELLYVTDPDAGRVLIYDTDGNCIASFGQYNQDSPDNTQFATVGGVAVDAEGNVYVSDIATGRVLRFDPYERVFPPPMEDEEALSPEFDVIEEEFTEEVTEEADSGGIEMDTPDVELTEEATSEN
jgi:predicted membrane-bound mannosyltransferase/sugar lactone lactonase YvrE